MELTEPDEELSPWERQPDEPTKEYAGFRIFRDMPAHQRKVEEVASAIDGNYRTVRGWAKDWDWRGRAEAWDDACHRIEDQERLEAIRSMHAIHRRAGRAAIVKAMQALNHLDPERMPVAAVARFLEIGARLERSTLIVSVEELQGLDLDDADTEDPWERIARELDPATAS